MELALGILIGSFISLMIIGISAYYAADDDEPTDGRLHGRVK